MNRKLKKVVCVILVLVLTLLVFTSCSSDNAEENNTDVKQNTDVENQTGETQEDKGIEGALEGVELSVGTSGLFAPFSYYADDGTTLIGFDLEFLYALQDLLGFTIADDNVQAMDYSALTTSVAGGKLDIAMAALCATDERKQVMNFSDTYYDSGQITVINKDTSPEGITGIDSLKSGDYLVAVEKGTASHLYAQANLPAGSLEVHDTITTAYESLEQGKVDALLQDQPGIAYYIKVKEGTKLEMAGEEFNQGQAPYAVAISFDIAEEYPDIVEVFNKAVEELAENGTMDELKSKWCE